MKNENYFVEKVKNCKNSYLSTGKNYFNVQAYQYFDLGCKNLGLENEEEINEFAVKCGFFVGELLLNE